MATITAVLGDITEQAADAVVNAAHSTMRDSGAGVDGAIHRAGGPAIARECAEHYPDGLPVGGAGWTAAGDLPARWVIHAVGPTRTAGEDDPTRLESCYRRVLEIADDLGARSVAFPLIGAGAHGWPHAVAVSAAIEAFLGTATRVEEIRIVTTDVEIHRRVRAELLLRRPAAVGVGTVGALFERHPAQFGLRGDPHLWRELRARFADTPLPATWFDLRTLLEHAIVDVVGSPPNATAPPHSAESVVHVRAWDPGHGMSAGSVDLSWWGRTGLPILIDRYEALR